MQHDQIIDNRYKIIRHLGSGGFGSVFLAEDTMVEEDVAIKVYNQMDNSGIQIFRQEYKKVSSLQHSHLLTTSHYGIENSRPFLVMPYCSEGNMTKYFEDEDNYMSEQQLADILHQIADGLSYLHRRKSSIMTSVLITYS